MYRAIAVDLDGTLLGSDSAMSIRTRAALDRCLDAGMRLVVATGRAKCSAATVLPEEFHHEAWACCNGADIYENGILVAENTLTPGLAKEIVRAIRSNYPEARVFAGMGGWLYTTEPLSGSTPHTVVDDLAATIDGPVAKVAFDLTGISDIEQVRACLPDGCRLIATVGGRLGEIMTPTATKAWAVETIVRRWGLDLADVVAFGDETNDLEMIAECGLGVAMGNAHPEVKAVAGRVAPPNDEDGVAQVLESLLLEE